MTKQVLGKGLGALIPSIEFSGKDFRLSEDANVEKKENFALIDVNKVTHNPYQPRKDFDHEALEDLKNSIIENGLIQPITVRKAVGGYELISGERRWRATKEAGLSKIPAYILEVQSDVKMLELALIENVQRENLNPIEVANGYNRLIDECKLTQEEVALKIGKDRTTITNFLRLLKLPDKVQDSLRHKALSMGHARALLAISDKNQLMLAWKETIDKNLSVRAIETLAREIESGKIKLAKDGEKPQEAPKQEKKRDANSEMALVLRDIENKLRHIYATQIKIATKSKESGSIEFEFYSKDDFERIIDLLSSIESK